MAGVRPQPATTCARKLKPGQVKRVPADARYLVGYHVACPGCGYSAPCLKEEGGILEAEEGGQRVLAALERQPLCLRCRRRIVVQDGRLAVL